MNKTMRIGVGLATLAMLALLAACDNSKEEEAAAQAAEAARQAAIKRAQQQKKAEDPLIGLGKAIALSKGQLPVDLRFELTAAPTPGAPAEVRLMMRANEDLEALLVAMSPLNDLQLQGELRPRFGPTKSGELRDLSFSAVAPATGIYLANVDITVTRPGGETTYEFVVPVGVPAPEAAASTAAK